MLYRLRTFFQRPAVLLAMLVVQSLLYWTLAIYLGGEAVRVAYQRF